MLIMPEQLSHDMRKSTSGAETIQGLCLAVRCLFQKGPKKLLFTKSNVTQRQREAINFTCRWELSKSSQFRKGR
jgi:hypothetical protein